MNDFSAKNMQLFFALDRRGCFGAKLNDFSASDMQLCFLSGSKRLLWSKVERSFSHIVSYEHAAGSKRLLWSEVERFSATNMQLFFLSGCFRGKLSDFSAQLFFFSAEEAAFGSFFDLFCSLLQ